MYVFPVGVDMLMSLCVDVVCVCHEFFVVSDVYMLNNVGHRTPPCGTPVMNWRYVDVVFLNVMYVLR